jgi:NAD-reducing hydrogenase large subunit
MTEELDRLETAEHPTTLKRVAIEPVTRVEGHGKVTLLIDDDDRIRQARLHIVEFRGFEKFVQGRPYWELSVMVQRLCGICPVSHHLAAAKAIDRIVGAERLTPTAEKIRRLLHFGQVLQSHALHFFHLSSPDLLFGYDDEVSHRNIVGVLADYPDIARQGILLRKFGQQVIETISGKRIHGSCAVPGGVNKSLTRDERRALAADMPDIMQWSIGALDLARRLYLDDLEHTSRFARIDTGMLSLSRDDGALELYDGGLRARNRDGSMIFDAVPVADYGDHIREQVKSWSYMKFPYLTQLGPDAGSYRVGPLARVNNCDFIDTPLAEEARIEFRKLSASTPVQSTLAFHWARMIELLHCAEAIGVLLDDDDLSGDDLRVTGDMGREGVGVIEAPRGTLFHHYEVDEQSLVTRANLIVSTTSNNRAMNDSIRRVALDELDGRTLTEGLLNRIEVAIRAYDPCLSCATHALGKMPLALELVDLGGNVVQQLVRDGDGRMHDTP